MVGSSRTFGGKDPTHHRCSAPLRPVTGCGGARPDGSRGGINSAPLSGRQDHPDVVVAWGFGAILRARWTTRTGPAANVTSMISGPH